MKIIVESKDLYDNYIIGYFAQRCTDKSVPRIERELYGKILAYLSNIEYAKKEVMWKGILRCDEVNEILLRQYLSVYSPPFLAEMRGKLEECQKCFWCFGERCGNKNSNIREVHKLSYFLGDNWEMDIFCDSLE